MGWRIFYKIESNQATITRCVGSDIALALPASIDGIPVTALGSCCFSQPEGKQESAAGIQLIQDTSPEGVGNNAALQQLSLPEGLICLHSQALSGCTGLVRLALPETVTEIGSKAFQGCRALERLILSPRLTALPDYAFADCRSLLSLVIPDGVTSVGNQCFYNCTHLKELDLPQSVAAIGSGVLMNCSRLERLTFPAGINASLLLSDLYQKLVVTIRQGTHATRLLFPEYAYEFEDIVMPRQFRTITYGSGGRYRECIGGNGIDLELYDAQFRVAKLEESPETVTALALFRLMDGSNLHDTIRAEYWDYLRAHLDALAPTLIQRDAEAELDFLLEEGNLTPEQIDCLLECARMLDHPRFASRILAQTRPKAETAWADKSFDL